MLMLFVGIMSKLSVNCDHSMNSLPTNYSLINMSACNLLMITVCLLDFFSCDI